MDMIFSPRMDRTDFDYLIAVREAELLPRFGGSHTSRRLCGCWHLEMCSGGNSIERLVAALSALPLEFEPEGLE